MAKLAPADFIARIAPIAVQLRLEGSPIFPSLRIAQAAHETGWKIHSWNNLVGLKVGSGKPNAYWDGSSVRTGTWEVVNGQHITTSANWRVYKTIEDCFRDQDRLFGITRYARVREAKSPQEQAEMLYTCGYATDPQYAAKLKNIMRTYGLSRYDEEVERVLQELQKKITALEKKVAELEKKQEPIPAPAWFVREFGSADLGGLINDPDGKKLPETWEAIALAARMAGIGKK